MRFQTHALPSCASLCRHLPAPSTLRNRPRALERPQPFHPRQLAPSTSAQVNHVVILGPPRSRQVAETDVGSSGRLPQRRGLDDERVSTPDQPHGVRRGLGPFERGSLLSLPPLRTMRECGVRHALNQLLRSSATSNADWHRIDPTSAIASSRAWASAASGLLWDHPRPADRTVSLLAKIGTISSGDAIGEVLMDGRWRPRVCSAFSSLVHLVSPLRRGSLLFLAGRFGLGLSSPHCVLNLRKLAFQISDFFFGAHHSPQISPVRFAGPRIAPSIPGSPLLSSPGMMNVGVRACWTCAVDHMVICVCYITTILETISDALVH